MKKFIASIAVLASLALASCSEGKYWDEPSQTTEYFAFPKAAATVTLSGSETISSYEVAVGRGTSGAAQSVNVTVKSSDESVISGPATVDFAAGQSIATYVLNVNSSAMQPGVKYTATVSLPGNGETGTEVSINSANKTFSLTLDKALVWKKLGWVLYTDDWMTGMYGLPECPTYYVEIEQAEGFQRYRLVNAYGANYPYNDAGDWDPSVTSYINIIADDPNRVYVENWQEQATDWGEGNFLLGSRASVYLNGGNSADAIANAGWFGKLANGKITFPASGLVITSVDNLADGYWYANKSGLTCVDLNSLTTTNPY